MEISPRSLAVVVNSFSNKGILTVPLGVNPVPLRVTLVPEVPCFGEIDRERLWITVNVAEADPASPESLATTGYDPEAMTGTLKAVFMFPESSACAVVIYTVPKSIATEPPGVKPDPVTVTAAFIVPLVGSKVIRGAAPATGVNIITMPSILNIDR